MSQQAEAALKDWATRRDRVAQDRDTVIRDAVAAGLTDVRIRGLTGVSRTTIARIRDPGDPFALAARARRVLRSNGVTIPELWTTRAGEVRLSLPAGDPAPWEDEDDPETARRRELWEESEWVGRMNWAGAVLAALGGAGITATPSDEHEGRDAQEHLAHINEQYVLLVSPAKDSPRGE